MRDVSSNAAYLHIRKRILNGKYPPGHALIANVLCSEIGVSRTPVREALRQLEADGLVLMRARVGASVKTMNIKEYRDVCAMRLALESHAAGLAAENRTPNDLQEIGIALEAMRRLSEQLAESRQEQALMEELAREDIRFHIAIMTAGKNDLMKKEILRLHLINRVVAGPTPADKGWAETTSKDDRDAHRRAVRACHEEIYAAVVRRDSAAAKQAMELHIQDIIDRVIRTLAATEERSAPGESTEEELIYLA
jgi:DNA-binding GntR family transcriptional regulator